MWVFSCVSCVCMQVEAIDFKLSVEQSLNDIKLDELHFDDAWHDKLKKVPAALLAISKLISTNDKAQAYDQTIALKSDIHAILRDIDNGK